MRVYALAEIGGRLAVHLRVRPEDAFATLDEMIQDLPECAATLFVVPVELDERELSAN